MTTSRLTNQGRLAAVTYAIRRIFIRPAPEGERCIMGYPVSEAVRCPRHIADDDQDQLWCYKHLRDWRGFK